MNSLLKITNTKAPGSSVIVAYQLLFDFKNFMRLQKGIHLLFSTTITNRNSKKFYLHDRKTANWFYNP